MVKKPILDFAVQESVVDRLVFQYREYLQISKACAKAEQQHAIAKISNKNENNNYKIIRRIQDRLSDEMTFYTPRIWMQYKHKAYKDTPKAIETIGDFVDHCKPKGYICTKRFNFIKNWLTKNENIKFEELQSYEDSISELIDNNSITALESNGGFILEWLDNEFSIINSRIAKWGAYSE